MSAAGEMIFMTFLLLMSLLICLCKICCKSEERAIYATPVVVTSQTHQPVGSTQAYPVNTGVSVQSYSQTTVTAPSMPLPYSDNAPYPTGPTYPMQTNAPYPPAPYGQQSTPYPPQGSSPYPPQGAPYPPQNSSYPAQGAPYPPQQEMMNPPAYNEVVVGTYQKQAPYNPNFSG